MHPECLGKNLVARNAISQLPVRCLMKDVELLLGERRVYLPGSHDCEVKDNAECLYFGQFDKCDGQVFHGFGMSFDKISGEVYAGQWTNGKKNGYGVVFYNMACHVYCGEFKDNERTGKCYVYNGNEFWGSYQRGYPSFGKMNLEGSTDVYTGSFYNNEREGDGRLSLETGTTYDCKWREGEIVRSVGTIREIDPDSIVPAVSRVYEGMLHDGGEPDGRGIEITLPTYGADYHKTVYTGCYYSGGWKDGKKEGRGTQVLPCGLYYVGDFEKNKFHGYGYVLYPDQSFYKGEFRDGLAHGTGVWRDNIGKSYTGEF